MRKLLVLALGAGLVACVAPSTPEQGMYEAFGAYSAAVAAAADYAEGPTADPAIARALNAVNQSREVAVARDFGRAYVLCGGSNATVVAGVDCAAFTFDATTVSAQASALRAATVQLIQGGR